MYLSWSGKGLLIISRIWIDLSYSFARKMILVICIFVYDV